MTGWAHKNKQSSPLLSTALAIRSVRNALDDQLQTADVDPRYGIDDYTIRQMQNSHAQFCGCAASVRERTSAFSASDDWATRPMPHGSSSASTVLLPPDISAHSASPCTNTVSTLKAWMHGAFPDAASTQALDDHAIPVTASVCARLAAEPSTARRNLAISPEHMHLIRTCHGGAAGHQGRDATIAKLQAAGHYWPTRFIDVARFIAACPHCQRYRLKQKMPYAMYKTILANAPLFGRWHMDFMSMPEPCSFTGAKKVLVLEEERSRFTMLHATQDETAIEAVIAFLHTFSIFGIPEFLYTDNAPNLAKAAVQEFVRLTGIQHDFSVPHQAHSNGVVERTCGETSRLLRLLCADLHAFGRWSLLLPMVQRIINSTTCSAIGCTPNQLVFGNRVNLDRFIIPTAPQQHDATTRAAAANADTVQHFVDTFMLAQQDLLAKADQLRIKFLNEATRNRPYKPDEVLQEGQLVLVPWNDTNRRPDRFHANFMGPYIVVKSEQKKGLVALAHTVVPTPSGEPSTLISAVTELRLFDDSILHTDYDVPEDRFRQLAYIDRNCRPIQCILNYRRSNAEQTPPGNHVSNFDYEVRF